MAYTVGFPPTGPKQSHLDRPSLPQKTGESGDAGDEMATAKPTTEGPAGQHGPSAEALDRFMRELNRPDYPQGMIPWLAGANPWLYAELTERLPENIKRLWEAHAPLEQFEKVLADLVDAHRRACAIYKAHLEARERSLRRTHEGDGVP